MRPLFERQIGFQYIPESYFPACTVEDGALCLHGHLYTAAQLLCDEGRKVAFAHFRYINPLPRNTREVLSRYKRVICAELNTGQFADFLQGRFGGLEVHRINKIQGQPFLVSDIVDGVIDIMDKQ